MMSTQTNALAGATHPSFSDVFLIIPSFVNKLTGLRIPPTRVFTHSLRAVLHFLNGASAQQLSEASRHHTLDDFVEDIHGTYTPATINPALDGELERSASIDSTGKDSQMTLDARTELL